MEALILLSIVVSFMLSACAGLGGSLILVPVLSFAMGPKEGIAMATALLACNNVAKLYAYRKTLALRSALPVLLLSAIGAIIGASLMVATNNKIVEWIIMISVCGSFLLRNVQLQKIKKATAGTLASIAGFTSGWAGNSGPLKGVAIKSLGLDPAHFVGAATVVSLVTDVSKSAVYWKSGLYPWQHAPLLIAALAIMPFAVYTGALLNRKAGQTAFNSLFWVITGGYLLKLLKIV